MTKYYGGRARNVGFSTYLRTGRIVAHSLATDIEAKFNPWHDPDDGRFTFSGGGTYFGPGSRSSEAKVRYSKPRAEEAARRQLDISSDAARALPLSQEIRRPQNHTIYIVKKGDSLSRVVAMRRGLTVSDLAWINGIPVEGVLKIGRSLRIPTQAWLDFNRERFRRYEAASQSLDFYLDAHSGKLPIPKSPDDVSFRDINVARPPSIDQQINSNSKTLSKNGYTFEGDEQRRVSYRAYGTLQFGTAAKRSRLAQANAGGSDRRSTDHGGHLIAARFNGPGDWFNHFAQDANFNNRAFKILENDWDRRGRAGGKVFVDVKARYKGLSKRPYEIEVRWEMDGRSLTKTFPNEAGGK